MQPPERFESKNLLIQKLENSDAQEIFDTYASRADILNYVSWKPHQSLEDTYLFLDSAHKSWKEGSHFSYSIRLRLGNDLHRQ